MFVRPEIQRIAGYVPGEQPRAGKFIKLNTNENPYPCSPAVARAIEAAVQQGLARYPDPLASAFRRRAAEVLGVEPDWILCGNGSDDILTIVTRAFVGTGQWLRLPYPSYILYKTLAQIQGAGAEEVHFSNDWSLGDAFAARLLVAELWHGDPGGAHQFLRDSGRVRCSQPTTADETSGLTPLAASA